LKYFSFENQQCINVNSLDALSKKSFAIMLREMLGLHGDEKMGGFEMGRYDM